MNETRLDADQAFDHADALAVLSWDYGLYAVWSALEAIPYRPAMGLTHETLEGEAPELYAEWEEWAGRADPYAIPAEAQRILDAIADAEPAP